MGVESANYKVLFRNGSLDDVRDMLRHLRAEQQVSETFEKWVLNGERHWIDLMLLPGPENRPMLSIRVALCNPADVEKVLHVVLTEVLQSLDGKLRDEQTGKTYCDLAGTNWTELQAAFSDKRDQFQRNFGPFEAAISGENVFPILTASRRGS